MAPLPFIVDPTDGYVMGRGRLYFTPFDDYEKRTLPQGLALDFFGNVPSLGLTINQTNYDHTDSTGGIREIDASVPLQVERTCEFTVEKCSTANLARYMMGSASYVTQAAVTGYTETISNVIPDRTYHVGVTTASPMGITNLTNLVIYLGTDATGKALTVGTDYVFDAARGSFKLLSPTSTLKGDGTDTLFITTDADAAQRQVSVSGNKTLRGRVDFKADNPYGEDIDFIMPNVTLRPNGAIQLIGDAFIPIPFTMTMAKAGDMAALYAAGQPVKLV